MNIFILNKSPILAARDHCNKHVVKMILESAQMLSTAHWINWQRMLQPELQPGEKLQDWLRVNVHKDLQPTWKMTHAHHPCTQWAARCWGNYTWLSLHGMELCREYEHRYGRTHKSLEVHRWLNRVIPPTFETTTEVATATTPFAIAMPEKYHVADNAVESYRSYYMGEKAHFAKWPADRVPVWWQPTSYLTLGGRHGTELNNKAEDEGTAREGESQH